jgi:23S rRNA pseudouridine2605 synthase
MEKMKKSEMPGERIAKVMARAGLCSRRDAEAWIANGRVSINGKVLTSAAINVGKKDTVLVDGQPLPEKQLTRVWLYYKPKGLMTTSYDPEGRATVFDNLPADMPRVISVGRLDLNSEGLLLLTNDGELARKLELPTTAWIRRYRVRVNGRFDPKLLEGLKDGIEIEGVRYGSIEAAFERQQGANAWLTMALTEGKNREIRRICQHFGWPVSRLIRVGYGPFVLGDMEPGQVQEVKGKLLQTQLRFGNDWRAEKAAEVEVAPSRPAFNRGPDKKTRDKLRDAPREGKREERAQPVQKPERRAPRPQHAEEEAPRPRRLQRADLPRWSERPRQEEAVEGERPQRRQIELKPKERREQKPRTESGDRPRWSERPRQDARTDGERPQRRHTDFKPKESRAQKPRDESGERPQKPGFKTGWAKNKAKKAQPGSHHGFKHQHRDADDGGDARPPRKAKAAARYEQQSRDNTPSGSKIPTRENAPTRQAETRSNAKPRGHNDQRGPDKPRDKQGDKPRGDKPRGKPASGHARRFG